ncbi:MAG: DUF2330 domain-containing protein [Sandaracinaceae bacterium]|nr:DUF2330 domain-containing protein [Sandaracinaceae bacterium]
MAKRRGGAGSAIGLVLVLGWVSERSGAHAFCGFYVSGADRTLYANATLVVLMREGNRTVLAMQNDYEGPPEDFAMVVPVPVVLQKDDVRTLPRDIFERVDRMAAPRLVEYWEQDPCFFPVFDELAVARGVPLLPSPAHESSYQVRVEARFSVGEYDIVILSAGESVGLERWLRDHRYNIPHGASEVLRPYVEAGTKFFVAKVNVGRVQFQNGRAVLSPLRFHYDTHEFSLPVRLGLLNSKGEQDLLVHILARNQRYEVANYTNTFIPTNLRVRNAVRENFGAFYEALFRATVSRNPRTVVTEYAWDAMSCDPCPGPTLTPSDIMTLGADVLPGQSPYGFTLTRLHYRYSRDTLGEDLVFQVAPPVQGGTGIPDQSGAIMQGVMPARTNMFQGRYVILHRWDGPVACEIPRWGRWGGPRGRDGVMPQGAGSLFSGIELRGRRASFTIRDFVEGALDWVALPAGVSARGGVVAFQKAGEEQNEAIEDGKKVERAGGDERGESGGEQGDERAKGNEPSSKELVRQRGRPGGGCASCTLGPERRPQPLVCLAMVLALWLCARRDRQKGRNPALLRHGLARGGLTKA